MTAGAGLRARYGAATLLSAALSLVTFTSAEAHPHVFVDATVAPVFDEMGRFAAVQEKWLFDVPFTEGIGPELDVNKDGLLSQAEIANAGGVGVLWFIPNDFFTRIAVGGQQVERKPIEGYAVTMAEGRLAVEFTVPLAKPEAVAREIAVDVFDPEIYVDVQFAEPGIDASKVPASCKAGRRQAPNLDPVAVMIIRRLGLSVDPSVINDPAAGYPVRIAIECK